ncbi:MAG TPA: ABC transporter permease [Gemmatimonadaceae bacterium]|nr:ABC transporter permease [Gemmatimonadaceae bacterium]
MRGTKRIAMWLRAFASRRTIESELDEEMRFHIDMEAAKHARRGLSDDEARRRASLAFGSVEHHKEAMREGRGVRGIERAAFDLRFGFRQLRKTPGFTVAAVLTLALGIGGNVAVFSVVDGVLLRPLAFPEPDRLVTIGHRTRGGDLPVSLPNATATDVVYQASHSFDAMALYAGWQASLTGGDAAPDWVDVTAVTRSIFDVLKVRPALGRPFTTDEDRPRGPRAVILSHALWRQRFGGDPSIIGRTIAVDGTTHEIVGVMPAGFAFPTPAVSLWVPMRVDRNDLGGFNTPGIARLRHGVTPDQATRELTQLLPGVTKLTDFLTEKTIRDAGLTADVHPYLDDLVGRVRPVLWTLWAMVGLVLLIACVNVASLLLVRAEARRREVALRVALGAERGHLLAQSLAESAMLLIMGTGLGVLLAWGAVSALPRLAPDLLPRLADIRIDAVVLVCTTLVAAVVAVAFGVVPVMRNRAVAPATMLRGGDRAATIDRHSGRLRQSMVVAQVAMATVLLVGSGLVLRSFQKLRHVDLGFRPDGVVTFRVALPYSRYQTSESVAQFHYAMLDRIRALPGVEVAGATGTLPLTPSFSDFDPLRMEGVTTPPDVLPPLAEMRVATPGYFEAMGIPVVAGRPLERSDTDGITGAVLVTQSIARKVMQGRPPIGARVAHGVAKVANERPWSNVVGVVGDVRGVSLDQEPVGAVYYAMVNIPKVDMDWLARSMAYAVRTKSPPAQLIASARRELARLDPTLPLAEARTMTSVVDTAKSGMRFSMIGFAVAAVIGLFMGAIGLYGVLSYVTAQRTREIGVRMALGATPSSVRTSILGRGVMVSAIGLAAGLAVAMSLRVLAKPLLYGITPTDPLTLAAVSLVLLSAGALAAWLPARRAARLDPVRALRWD